MMSNTPRDASSQAAALSVAPLPSPAAMASLPVENMADAQMLTRASSVRIEQVNGDGEVAEPRDFTDKQQLAGDCESGIRGVEYQGSGRYEYMDIRRSDSTEGEDPARQRCASPTPAEETDRKVGHEDKEATANCQNTSKQPTFQGNLSSTVVPEPDVLTAGVDEVAEYEEMTRLEVVTSGWEQADYQNLPVKGRTVCEAMGGSRCTEIGGYIKVCAAMGEPGSNTSFDNPDYWHSRLFLKPDAVRI